MSTNRLRTVLGILAAASILPLTGCMDASLSQSGTAPASISIQNVRVPFTQVLRIRGSYNGTVTLGGDEIEAQLLANQFGGVVNQVRDSYVDVFIPGACRSTTSSSFKRSARKSRTPVVHDRRTCIV